jgi:transposase
MRRNKAESEQLRTKAYELYMNANMTYSEIAEAVGVGKDTISDWAGRFKWKETKAANSITREKNVARMLVQIQNLLDAIDSRDQKYPTPAEADTISKMTKNISELSGRTSLPDYFNVQTEFLKYLHITKPDLAKQVVSYSKDFLQGKVKELDK